MKCSAALMRHRLYERRCFDTVIECYLSAVVSEEERSKIELIYERYYSVMCYSAGKYLNNIWDIEDVVHNSMLKIIKNISSIDISDVEHTKISAV